MRLGTLIAKLKAMPSAAVLYWNPITDDMEGVGEHPGGFDSYRGYYERLAIDPDGPPCTVAEFVKRARACVGTTFHGWKGGEFVMTENTLVHIARRGETTDNRIVGVELNDDGGVDLLVAHVEDW